MRGGGDTSPFYFLPPLPLPALAFAAAACAFDIGLPPRRAPPTICATCLPLGSFDFPIGDDGFFGEDGFDPPAAPSSVSILSVLSARITASANVRCNVPASLGITACSEHRAE